MRSRITCAHCGKRIATSYASVKPLNEIRVTLHVIRLRGYSTPLREWQVIVCSKPTVVVEKSGNHGITARAEANLSSHDKFKQLPGRLDPTISLDKEHHWAVASVQGCIDNVNYQIPTCKQLRRSPLYMQFVQLDQSSKDDFIVYVQIPEEFETITHRGIEHGDLLTTCFDSPPLGFEVLSSKQQRMRDVGWEAYMLSKASPARLCPRLLVMRTHVEIETASVDGPSAGAAGQYCPHLKRNEDLW